MITDFKRTRKYSKKDYSLVINILNCFDRWVTLSNILTEVSNLSNQLPKHRKPEYFEIFAKEITLLEEHYLESKEISQIQALKKYSITDVAISMVSPQKFLVLTDDFPLLNYLRSQDVEVINFNHIRF